MSKEPGAEEGEAQTRFPAESGRLAERSFGALKWNYLGAAVRVIAQLVIGIILARLLGPEPFGLVAIAWFVVGLGNLMADLGFGSALVQREQVHEEDTRYVFTILVVVALMMTCIVASMATLISDFFHRADATPVIQVLALLFVLQVGGQVPASLLRRELKFKAVQIAQAGSYLASYLGLGIPLAIFGAGVWSLVVAALAQALLCSIMLFASHPHVITPRLSPRRRGLFGFGAKVMGSNLANFTINNIDTAIIGRAFGVVDLGLYNRVLQLVSTPMNALMSNLSAVLFPAYSRAQSSAGSLRKTYFASLTLIGLFCLPAFTSIALVPEAIVIGLYGQRWNEAIPLLTPLSLGAAVTGLLALSGPLMLGIGRPGAEFRAQAISAVLTVSALLLASKYSLLILAWTLLAVFLVRFLLVTRNVLVATDTHWSQVSTALLPPVTIAFVTGTLVKAMDLAMRANGLAAAPRLALDGLTGAICLFLSVLALRRWIFAGDVGWLIITIQTRLPPFVRRVLIQKHLTA